MQEELKPSAARLRELFHYDAASGALTWKSPLSNATPPGSLVGSVDSKGRLRAEIAGKSYAVHHIIWAINKGAWPESQLDHEDRDKTNNRMHNLRLATNAQNSRNRTNRSNTTGFKGVSFHKRQGKFNARIMVDGICHNLGSFVSGQEAAHEYNKAAVRVHGEFACLNPIGIDYESA